eukprot:scaffold55239_cov18-Tisochrysis_lutea.AAC.4
MRRGKIGLVSEECRDGRIWQHRTQENMDSGYFSPQSTRHRKRLAWMSWHGRAPLLYSLLIDLGKGWGRAAEAVREYMAAAVALIDRTERWGTQARSRPQEAGCQYGGLHGTAKNETSSCCSSIDTRMPARGLMLYG